MWQATSNQKELFQLSKFKLVYSIGASSDALDAMVMGPANGLMKITFYIFRKVLSQLNLQYVKEQIILH